MKITIVFILGAFGSALPATAESLKKFLDTTFVSDSTCKVEGCESPSPWKKISPICAKLKFSKDRFKIKTSPLTEPLFLVAENLCDVKSAVCYGVKAVEVPMKNCLNKRRSGSRTQVLRNNHQRKLRPSNIRHTRKSQSGTKQALRQNLDVVCLINNRAKCTGLDVWRGSCPCIINYQPPSSKLVQSAADYYTSEDYYSSDYDSQDEPPRKTDRQTTTTTTRRRTRTTRSHAPEPPSYDSLEPTDPQPPDSSKPTDPQPPQSSKPTDPQPPASSKPTNPQPPDPPKPTDPQPPDSPKPTESQPPKSSNFKDPHPSLEPTKPPKPDSPTSTGPPNASIKSAKNADEYSSDYDIQPLSDERNTSKKKKKKEQLRNVHKLPGVWLGCKPKETTQGHKNEEKKRLVNDRGTSEDTNTNKLGCPLTSKIKMESKKVVNNGPLRMINKKLKQYQKVHAQ